MISVPTVSVIIPYFNRPKQLVAALHSLSSEMEFILEVIIVDDGSEVQLDAGDLLDFSDKITIIRRAENGGPAAARSEGVKKAKGDLIAFLDSDDVWLAGKLSAQLPYFSGRTDSLLAVATGWQDYSSTDKRSNCRVPIPAGNLLLFSSGCWYCPGSTILVTRASFNQVGLFDAGLKRLEDYDWFLRFGMTGGRLEVCPTIGAIIRDSNFSARSEINTDIIRVQSKWVANPHFLTDSRLKRNQNAWLLLAQASIARNAGKPFQAASYLAASWTTLPRMSIHLEKWWQHLPGQLTWQKAGCLLGLE